MAVSRGRQEFEGPGPKQVRAFSSLDPDSSSGTVPSLFTAGISDDEAQARALVHDAEASASTPLAAVFLGDVARRSPTPDSAPRAATSKNPSVIRSRARSRSQHRWRSAWPATARLALLERVA
jgi:hypothetical protein